MRLPLVPAALAAVLAFAAGCGEERPPPAPDRLPDAGPPPAMCPPGGARVLCEGDVATSCDAAGRVDGVRDCAATSEVCVEGLGCRTCQPRTQGCALDGGAETTRTCNDDGTAWTNGPTCDAAAGLRCHPGGCADLCAMARAQRSYLGCEYLAVPTLNSQIAIEFQFAVVVANPQLVPARVEVSRGPDSVASVTIPPRGLESIALPWIPELKGTYLMERSAAVADGAYRVASDVPVTVHQFNALEYSIPRDCADEPRSPDGICFSYTNDASLLLPTHVLTGSYLAIARPTHGIDIDDPKLGSGFQTSPGFVTLVGASEQEATVEIVASAPISASTDGRIPSIAAGGTATFTLAPGEVIQLVGASQASCPTPLDEETFRDTRLGYCDFGAAHDLTGTEIRASHPIAVVSGHNCTFVPFNRWACDHLEEAMFPIESWGREILVAATEPIRGEPNLLRVVAAQDGTMVTFAPLGVREPALLDRGDWVELEISGDVRVSATGPIAAAQYLVGQDYAGIGSSGARGIGDPAMALGIPSEQFRTEYTFLAPRTYRQSWVDVVAPTGAEIALDGCRVDGWREVPGTPSSTSRVAVSGGTHSMTGTAPFGIVLYGFGEYTSYMLPGGLDFREIAPPF